MNKQQRRAIALYISASLLESSTNNDGAITIVFNDHPDISRNDADKVLGEIRAIAHQLRDRLKYLPDTKVQAK